MIFEIPNGIIEGNDYFNKVTIDEIRGKQQNYLANRDLVVGNIGHVPKLLEDLIISLETSEGVQWQGPKKELIYRLPAGDLETILIKIRENTYGPRFYFEAECDHCNHVNKDQRLDLNKLEIKKLTPEELLDKKRVTYTLPKSKKEIVFKPIYLKDLFESIKIAKHNQDKLITSIIHLSIKSIDGKEVTSEKDIEDFPALDLVSLQKQLEKINIEGTIDTDIIIKCSKCGKEFNKKLNVFDADFFDPSKGSMNSQ